MIYTSSQLNNLAQNSPEELVQILISPGTDIKVLVTGAELLCDEITDETVILPVIKILLKHKHALVRESAVIGLAGFYSNRKPPKEILDILIYISTNDPFVQLKNYAKDIIKDMMD